MGSTKHDICSSLYSSRSAMSWKSWLVRHNVASPSTTNLHLRVIYNEAVNPTEHHEYQDNMRTLARCKRVKRRMKMKGFEVTEYRHERAKVNVETRRVTYGAKWMCRTVDRRGMKVRCEYMVSSVRTYISLMAG